MLQDTAKFQLLGHAIKSFLNQAQKRLGNHQQPWKFWKPESQKLKQCLRTLEQRFWNCEEEAVSCQEQSAARAFKRWCLRQLTATTAHKLLQRSLVPFDPNQGSTAQETQGTRPCWSPQEFTCFLLPPPHRHTRDWQQQSYLIPAACRASTSLNYTSLRNLLFAGQFSHT